MHYAEHREKRFVREGKNVRKKNLRACLFSFLNFFKPSSKMDSIGGDEEMETWKFDMFKEQPESSFQSSSLNLRKENQRKKRSQIRTPSFRFTSIIAIVVVFIIFASLTDSVNAAKDYYKIMGVDRKADERTIKKAYRVSNL